MTPHDPSDPAARPLDSIPHVLEAITQAIPQWHKDIDFFARDTSIQKDKTALQDIRKLHETLDKLKEFVRKAHQEQAFRTESYEGLRHFRHDLRAALGAVIGFAEMVQEFCDDSPSLTPETSDTVESFILNVRSLLSALDSIKLRDADAVAAEAHNTIELHTENPGHILVVDDNPDKLNMIARRVEQIGHHVSTAVNGHGGLRAVGTQSPDLILLDLMMPDISGLQVLEQLKGDDRFREIPVLMISSSSDINNVIECIKAGADDYLPIPLNHTLLFSRIESSLSKKFARDREIKTMKKLVQTQESLSMAIENMADGLVIYDTKDRITNYNSQFRKLYPHIAQEKGTLTHSDLLKRNLKEKIYLDADGDGAREEQHPCDYPVDPEAWLGKHAAWAYRLQGPHEYLLKPRVWVEVTENELPGGGSVAVHKDITQAKVREQELEYSASHDPLTGLANRDQLERVLDRIYTEAVARNRQFAVMFFDLDGFKEVNDSLGHDYGDRLLIAVSERIQSKLRRDDTLARLGGDEFLAVLYPLHTQKQALEIAERCRKAVGTHIETDDKTIAFGVSIGVAVYPHHGADAQKLLSAADQAMYKSKKTGKGKVSTA